ncbi:helix-turn-helix transcriptional regulator [Streptomyces sp. PmtG]
MTRPRLTTRQRDALALIANGYTNAQVGSRFGVSENCVSKHLAAIRKHLGARDRTHAVAIALTTGLLTPTDIQPRGGDR